MEREKAFEKLFKCFEFLYERLSLVDKQKIQLKTTAKLFFFLSMGTVCSNKLRGKRMEKVEKFKLRMFSEQF
jgi:hypothetical protein